MSFNYYQFKEYEDELMDDELIKSTIDLLTERYEKMANWLKENDPLKECPNCHCKNEDKFNYKHNGVVCEECGHKVDKEVPYPAKGGVVASRKFVSVMKEMFSLKLARTKRKNKPTKEQLRALPISLGDFDSGEYSPAESKFLKQRYEDLIGSSSDNFEGTDKFMYHALVLQELKLIRLYREEAVNPKIDNALEKKRETQVYTDLASKVKASRDSRDNEEEKTIVDDLMSDLEGESVEDIVKDFKNRKENMEEELEKSKQKRREIGNPY